MIGFIEGKVIFSDGQTLILLPKSGVGHEVYYDKVLREGHQVGIFISQIVREDSLTLYGFASLKDKKTFELLLGVKGVGPKGAYSLVSSLGSDNVCESILLENKAVLKKAPGIGPKAAAQMILDLKSKIVKMKMYNSAYEAGDDFPSETFPPSVENTQLEALAGLPKESFKNEESQSSLLTDTLMACKELGFQEEDIVPLAHKILSQHKINKAEQLVHLVLKNMH